MQSCTRPVNAPETVRGVAGHMHLLGRSIKVEANPGTPRARTLLNIPVWDFDNQGSKPIKPAHLRPGDTVKVTCEHTQTLRDDLPALKGQPDKYVVWVRAPPTRCASRSCSSPARSPSSVARREIAGDPAGLLP